MTRVKTRLPSATTHLTVTHLSDRVALYLDNSVWILFQNRAAKLQTHELLSSSSSANFSLVHQSQNKFIYYSEGTLKFAEFEPDFHLDCEMPYAVKPISRIPKQVEIASLKREGLFEYNLLFFS